MASEFEALQIRVEEIFSTVDETALIVLKGHLLVEEMLDEIIRTCVYHADYLDAAQLRFAQKLQVARSLSLNEHTNGMWELAISLNSLRNELAHTLHSEKRERKTKALLEIYFREAHGSKQAEIAGSLPEHVVAAYAITFLIGFLSSFRDEVRRFRKLTDEINLAMASHRT